MDNLSLAKKSIFFKKLIGYINKNTSDELWNPNAIIQHNKKGIILCSLTNLYANNDRPKEIDCRIPAMQKPNIPSKINNKVLNI